MMYFKNNHLSLKKILCCIFEKEIIRIKYLRTLYLKHVPEYNFSMLKFNIVFKDYSNCNIYIRMINKEKIDENLFCYWLFCENNFGMKANFSNSRASIINCTSQKYETKYKLQVLKAFDNTCKDSIVDIIDLNTYSKEKLISEYDSNIQKNLFIAFG